MYLFEPHFWETWEEGRESLSLVYTTMDMGSRCSCFESGKKSKNHPENEWQFLHSLQMLVVRNVTCLTTYSLHKVYTDFASNLQCLEH